MTTSGDSQIEVFNLRTPLLSSGRTDRLLAETDGLWLRIKVYATGGENNLHHHPSEDHAFVILDGQATFYDQEGSPTVVDKHGGVMLPKGTYYHFRSTAPEALVMLRVGSGVNPHHSPGRFDADGRLTTGVEDPAAVMPIVEIPGRFYGDK
jgi:mannose-6-phosphate isomerase-like protein (cupin superfamily)